MYNKFKYFGQTIEDEDENNKYNNNKRLWIHAVDLFQANEMFISTLVKGNKTSDAKPTRGCSRLCSPAVKVTSFMPTK
jgi:hypothetical protein